MSSIKTIHNVLRTPLLMPQLMVVPERGATDEEISLEEDILGRSFCRDHVAFLREWNGIGLEVVRFFGCGPVAEGVGRISALQPPTLTPTGGAIAVGSDASGFIYFQEPGGRIFSFDTDGGSVKLLANSIDDFVTRVIFGPDAHYFCGDEWLAELRNAGLV